MIPNKLTNKVGRRSQKFRTSARGATQAQIGHIPPVKVWPTLKHVLRFQVATGGGGTRVISYADLMDSINVTPTATTAFQLYDLMRLRRVRIWTTNVQAAAGTAISANTQCKVAFIGGTNGQLGDMEEYEDVSVSPNFPAHLDVRPSPKSQLSQWQVSSAFVAMTMIAPFGSIIEIDIDFRMDSDIAPVAVSGGAPVGATAGQVCFRGLDGLPIATTLLPPLFTPTD